MVLRSDLYQLIDELPDADLDDALDLLTTLRDRDARLAELAGKRSVEAEARYQAAVAEGVRHADDPASGWVSQDDMEHWLELWGTDHELPPPPAHPRH